MKIRNGLVVALMMVVALAAHAQMTIGRVPIHEETYSERQDRLEAERKAKAVDLAEKQKYFVPRDPWRCRELSVRISPGVYETISESNYAKGPEWYQFYGCVKQINLNHIIIQGWYGPPLDYENGYSNVLFRVNRFPYKPQIGTELKDIGKFVARLMPEEYGELRVLDYQRVIPVPGTVQTPSTNLASN